MKRIFFIAFIILLAAMAGILLIHKSQVDTDVTANTTRVGVFINGKCQDRSWCQTHYEALESLKEELNLDILYKENAPGDCYAEIKELIQKDGCRIIIGCSFDYGEAMKKAAAEYPHIYFLNAGGVYHQANYSSFFGRMYQARYLSGIVAGQKTQTGELGYVAAFPNSQVIRGINAFTLGVRSVRPDAQVHVSYCKSWTDDEPALTACRKLLDNFPIDVLTVHTNSLTPHQEAENRGIWSIGYHRDNRDLFPHTYLSACVWNWQAYYREQIQTCLQGKFHGKQVWIDKDKGIVSLASLSPYVDMDTAMKVRAANERFGSRGFDVFYGPIKDNQGNLRINAGESMSDDEMLNAFDWYVEGVNVED
ncbi:BMP family ABC transporter substrate-binding protein [Selenomonas ruminantium]|uniref:Nucleoside-binding protein n=1 Tax=Selenomonas ruminantium TaxID=971 RepID=A0A1H0RNL8_SELRU|nr:BMP family ABC transporter substrate-binding protein [Selenomonas ruminantium]SDP31005.1 nucleoside-binding protein [Selenomonas ruminantium]